LADFWLLLSRLAQPCNDTMAAVAAAQEPALEPAHEPERVEEAQQEVGSRPARHSSTCLTTLCAGARGSPPANNRLCWHRERASCQSRRRRSRKRRPRPSGRRRVRMQTSVQPPPVRSHAVGWTRPPRAMSTALTKQAAVQARRARRRLARATAALMGTRPGTGMPRGALL